MRNTAGYLIAILILWGSGAGAQDLRIPEPGTSQRIDQEFGPGRITITYSRPNAKGRKMLPEHGELPLLWGNTVVSLRLETNVNARVMANIEKVLKD